MIRDANSLQDGTTLRTEICVVGAGAAGITLASELSSVGLGVIVLEGGDLTLTSESQSLYDGANIGRPYYSLMGSRLRFFGGTTNHYAGHFAPLDALDYESRPGLPETGWPLSPEDLGPYYARAHDYCQLGPVEFGADYWSRVTGYPPINMDPSRFRTLVRQISPTRFGSAYRRSLESSDSVSIYLNANVTDLVLENSGNNVAEIVASNNSDSTFTVHATIFVIAAGGLENPRLLLNANKQRSAGLGNEYDLVGRYFMEHIAVKSGFISFAADKFDERLYTTQEVDVGRDHPSPQAPLSIQAFLSTRPDFAKRNGLANVRMSFDQFSTNQRSLSGLKSAKHLLRDLKSFEKRDDSADDFLRVVENLDAVANQILGIPGIGRKTLYKPMTVIEQLPNPMSRVKLVDQKDRFGLRKIALDWQWTADDKRTVAFFNRAVAEELGRTGLGRMRLELDNDAISFGLPFAKSDEQGNYLRAGNHHMGTTRMSVTPRRGVVDQDCRLHSTKNLYVAGSSVFPTAGLWNPTLTIVALTVRLADHLKKVVK